MSIITGSCVVATINYSVKTIESNAPSVGSLIRDKACKLPVLRTASVCVLLIGVKIEVGVVGGRSYLAVSGLWIGVLISLLSIHTQLLLPIEAFSGYRKRVLVLIARLREAKRRCKQDQMLNVFALRVLLFLQIIDQRYPPAYML